jgi:hypothetical protein
LKSSITALIAVLPARVTSVGVGKEPSALPRKTVAVALPEVAGLLIEIRSPLPSPFKSEVKRSTAVLAFVSVLKV